MTTNAYFVFYAKLLQDLDKGLAKDDSRMRLHNLNNIEQHRYWFATVLEMDCEGNIGLMVRDCYGCVIPVTQPGRGQGMFSATRSIPLPQAQVEAGFLVIFLIFSFFFFFANFFFCS